MNKEINSLALHTALIAMAGQSSLWAAEEDITLNVLKINSEIRLSWPGVINQPDGTTIRPYFELQSSSDLKSWGPFGERIRAASLAEDPTQAVTVGTEAAQEFFRLLTIMPPSEVGLASAGDEVFGFSEAFSEALTSVGQISPLDFLGLYPVAGSYLPEISWDPTTALFWDLFSLDTETFNQGLDYTNGLYRHFDTRLTDAELAVFNKNGFVVSERLGGQSFAGLFYRLWWDDLPVFVSADAILQAWHRTYDSMVQEVEETALFNSTETILDGMSAGIPEAWATAGDGVLRDSILDADYILTVARSLLAGPNVVVPSALGQDERVTATLQAVADEQLELCFDLFGTERTVDFSQFKVRGHYEESERLGRYFQCVMWLGRTDLRVAGGPFQDCPFLLPHMAYARETGTAIVLWHLLQQSGEFDRWLNFDRTIQAFVGWTDSMTFAQLGSLLAAANIHSLTDVPDLQAIEALQQAIVEGNLGAQNIRSDYFVSPLGPEKIQLPQSFTVFGQKFVPDSWALSKFVYDDILWVENGETNKVCRRVPSAIDVAFAVLGNNQVVPEIVDRILDPNAAAPDDPVSPYRDGTLYQHNLTAVRDVIDRQSPEAWEGNIYTSWLDTLRALSASTTSELYPEVMRTRAWAMKTVNTQLASWTQLRHDTILYAKQSYTPPGGSCIYPAGYVEPRIEFWRRFHQMITRTIELITALPYEGSIGYLQGTNALVDVKDHQLSHLNRFAETVASLEGIALKELAEQSLTEAEEAFLRSVVEDDQWFPIGYRDGLQTYSGWYPALFYRQFAEPDDLEFHQTHGAEAWDALVADVHTDIPSPPISECPSPGHVLHEGIGDVNLLMIAVESGEDRMVFAGPVLSHYEFSLEGAPQRMTDKEWQDNLDQQRWQPNSPDVIPTPIPNWTRDYLVPKTP